MSETASCSKCGKAAADPVCPACGGRVVRGCPACGFKNSLAKNFCDACGSPTRGAAPAKAAPPSPSRPKASDLEPPKTMITRAPAPAAAPKPAPRTPPRAPAPPAQAAPARPRGRDSLSVLSALTAALLLVGGGALYGWRWHKRRTPRALLLTQARDYLSKMAARDYEGAYAHLSRASRAECPLEEFKLAQDQTRWSFHSVAVDSDDDDWALVRYTLAVEGRPEEKDWMHFALEDGVWRRSYWWNLMERIEGSLGRKDYAKALESAKAAALASPRDPMARGYLCETAYYADQAALTEEACTAAIELLQKHPSRLTAESIYHLHAVLGDTYKNRLGKYAEAAREYGVLLAFPRLSREDQCDLLLARADTYALMGEHSGAASDFKASAKACEAPSDLDYAERALKILSGGASEEAVLAAQDHRMEDDRALLEWSEGLGEDGLEWLPEHSGGSLYQVRLKSGGTEVLSARVDLWTHTVGVNFHVR